MTDKIHGLVGKKKSLEHIKRIQASLKGRKTLSHLTEEQEMERRRKISEAMKGRKITWANKISEAQVGRPKPEELKNKVSAGLKKHFAEGGKVWNKGIEYLQIKGSKNPKWKGGVTEDHDLIRKSVEYYEWRRLVKKRDGYKCQHCGSNKKLNAHHIQFFSENPELRYELSNGITLCEPCHMAEHKRLRSLTTS